MKELNFKTHQAQSEKRRDVTGKGKRNNGGEGRLLNVRPYC